MLSTALLLLFHRADCSAAEQPKYSGFRYIPKKTKVVHFVRHAEGYHNVSGRQDPKNGYLKEDLEDAVLTDEGICQCVMLSTQSQNYLKNAELVVMSPMRRTIQTATYSFPQLIGHVPFVAIECLREQTGIHPCDRRRPISEYRERFCHVDFSQVKDESDPLYHLYSTREPEEDILNRGREFMRWLAARPESEIVVVSHAGFLRRMFKTIVETDMGKSQGEKSQFSNGELRTVLFNFPEIQEDRSKLGTKPKASDM